MRMRIFCVLFIMLLGVAGCQSQGTDAPPPVAATLEIGSQPTLTPTALSAQELIRKALAYQLGVDFEEVQMHAIEAVEWPDGCLGAPQAGEMCPEAITPGYGGILIVQGVLYHFHSDLSGKHVRFIPGAAITARQILADQLGIKAEAIQLVSVENVLWEDICLEITTTGLVCDQVQTPGYRITLDADGSRYEYHSDESGGDVRLANAPEMLPDQGLLTWMQISDQVCRQVTISRQTVAFGACGATQMTVPLAGKYRAEELEYFITTFAAFDAETPAGQVKLAGQGSALATPADQRMAAEWARLVMLEAQGGDDQDARGLLFAWRRQGDVAGTCQDVTVYLSGMARIGDCRDEQLQVIDQVWLTANQMSTLYTWVDSLQSFSVESDATTSLDGMPKGLFFIGAGQEAGSDFETAYLTDLAEVLLTQAQTEPVQADIDTARVALEAYLSALADGNYSEAAALYGGSIEVLELSNPTLNPADRAALFQAACTLNGFVCYLNVLNFVHEAQLSASDFRFTVELQNPDGSLFQLGPCCGADPAVEPPWTQFDFIVHKLENGLFQVLDLPIFIP